MPSSAGKVLPVAILLLAACGRKQAEPAGTNAYADARVCAACHQAIANSYKQTGMARAFRKATPADAPDTPLVHKVSGRRYQFQKRDGKLFLRRDEESGGNPIEKEVHYVLGSGNHARSYLHKTPQNRLIEMPVNWYPPNGGFLAMSPGYDRPDHMDMRRAIGYECMFCHNSYPQIPNASSADDPVFPGVIPEGIDCQRCHGPGRAHVEAPGRGNILNPRALSKQRQQEVCMQCHLEPTSYPLPNAIVRYERAIFSYNPKDPLSDHIVHFDHAPGAGHDGKFEIASSAYRLRQSKCWLSSNEQLTCTTCHNPHAVTREFDAACRQCHQTLAKHPAKQQDCAGCHMPKRRTEDVIHVVVTDHRIQRPPANARTLLAPRTEHHEQMGSTSYQGEVVLYYPRKLDNDLYPALAQVAHQSNLTAGIPRLEAALQTGRPGHPAYYLQMAQAYHASGEPAKAIPYYRKALEKDPNYLPAIRSLGASQARLGQLPEAEVTLERATKQHPNDSLVWLELARVYRQQRKEAAMAARKAVELEPELVDAQVTLGMALLHAGDRAGAETAFRAAIREKPDESDAHTNLGNILNAKGETKEAERHFLDAIRYNAKSAAARYNIAVFLANQRRFPEAIPHAKESIALEPNNLNSRDLLGNLYAAARLWREAAVLYRETLKLNPSFPRAQLGLGTALGALNDFNGARLYLRQAAESPDPAVRAEAADLLRSLP
ncbi:MAG: tetratricopeptide repeat protein [Acidobacteria bacterium]|nr:tetratricopeptide repeat protein [Acidobacteriota bacterium]